MKILYLVELFPKNITGGVESRYYYLTKYLRVLGCNVQIISRSNKWDFSSWSSVFSRFLYLILGTILAIKSDFDLIEGTNYTNYLIASIAGLIKRKSVFFCYHDVLLGSWIKNVGPIGIIGEIAERIILKLPVTKYIAVSEVTKNKLVEFGIKPNKIEVVHNGIDPEEFKITKAPKKLDIICVSRLVSYKHVEDLILAVKKAGFTLGIIGQGPEREKLDKLGGKVKFFGFIAKHEDVLATISSAKVYCSPSTVEGFGITAIEAAALGVPMVLADIPAFREVSKNGQGTLFFEPRSITDLTIKLQKLLKDKKLSAKKSNEAKILSKNYFWPDLAIKLLQNYENCLYH